MSRLNFYSIVRDSRFRVCLLLVVATSLVFLFITHKTVDQYSEKFIFFEETYRSDLENIEQKNERNEKDELTYKEIQEYYQRAKGKNDFYASNRWKEALKLERADNLAIIKDLKDKKSENYDSNGNIIMEFEINNSLYSYFISKNIQPRSQDSNNAALVNTFRFLSIIVPIALIILIPLILMHQFDLDYKDRLFIKRLEPFGLGKIVSSKIFCAVCSSLLFILIPIGIVFLGSILLNGYGDPKFPIVLQTINSYELVSIGSLLSKTLFLTVLITIFVTLLSYLIVYYIKIESLSIGVFIFLVGGSLLIPNKSEIVNKYLHFNVFSHLSPTNMIMNTSIVKYGNSNFNFIYSGVIISIGIIVCALISWLLIIRDKKR